MIHLLVVIWTSHLVHLIGAMVVVTIPSEEIWLIHLNIRHIVLLRLLRILVSHWVLSNAALGWTMPRREEILMMLLWVEQVWYNITSLSIELIKLDLHIAVLYITDRCLTVLTLFERSMVWRY